MKSTTPARIALWVLLRLGRRNEALTGDLVEQFQAGRSTAWLWLQIAMAIAYGSFREPRAPVALNLTPIDPVVAEWLMWRKLPPHRINLGSPVEGVGALGIMLLALHLNAVVPDIWWLVFGGMFLGVILGVSMAFRRRNRPLQAETRIHTGHLRDLFADARIL